MSSSVKNPEWVHKTANVLNQMPKSLQAKAKGHLHDIFRRRDFFGHTTRPQIVNEGRMALKIAAMIRANKSLSHLKSRR